ncbi:Uncharacterised protein [Bordetella pertussis]|nr:Uncharacterised protein [Bordetella pertussis]
MACSASTWSKTKIEGPVMRPLSSQESWCQSPHGDWRLQDGVCPCGCLSPRGQAPRHAP